LVQRCIAALLRWTRGPARLILIDDASPDAGVAALLADYARHDGIIIRRNPQNLGYTRSSNLGIELAGAADVVLLNADTQVGPRWLDALRQTAYADAAIGTVTAVSDNAGAFSVPELEQFCPIPSNWTLPMAQRALLHNAAGCLPELPTGNGFCMFIKRAVLDRVGVLDAEAFPSGYGEENDLCQRAERAGFRHVIAGNVFVQHERSASFGEARRLALGAQGMQVLRSRYPDYEGKVGATLFGYARRVLDYRVRRIYADRDGIYVALPPRARIALAMDESGPGAMALAAALQFKHECFVLPANECAEAADVENRLAEWLANFAIELVHIVSARACDEPLLRAAARTDVPVLDSSADARLQAWLAMEPPADPAATAQLAEHCTALYQARWRDTASWPAAGMPA
jgi:glycosyltransferase involved in cell wall biosynthesis